MEGGERYRRMEGGVGYRRMEGGERYRRMEGGVYVIDKPNPINENDDNDY